MLSISCNFCTKNLVLLWRLCGALWFIFHWVQFILKLDADKVRSIDCLIYSDRVCTPWAVKLQNSNRGNTETLKTFREHICLRSLPALLLPPSFMLFVVVRMCIWVLCVDFQKELLPAPTHAQTSVSHPWPCGRMLYRLEKRGFEGMTYHLTLYYIRLQSHMAS